MNLKFVEGVTRLPVTFGLKYLKSIDEHWVGEAVSLKMAQSWPWDSQIAVKKKTT